MQTTTGDSSYAQGARGNAAKKATAGMQQTKALERWKLEMAADAHETTHAVQTCLRLESMIRLPGSKFGWRPCTRSCIDEEQQQ